MDVSIIIPTYNREKTLENSIKKIIKRMQTLNHKYEIIIAEDGCLDRTPEIARQLSKKHKFINHIHNDKRLGRGKAIKNSFKIAKGRVVIYMDDDLATDLVYLPELIDSILKGQYDIATGSRYLPQSKVFGRKMRREIASRGFNFFVRLFLKSKLRDHQCGFKAFSRKVIENLSEEVEDNHWFFDTEILVRGQWKNYNVMEFPVVWTDNIKTSVNLYKDVRMMTKAILRLLVVK